MSAMILPWLRIVIEFALGCGLLAVAADRLIIASTSIARHYNWSPLLIGMLLVGFGTSFPELVVSLMAAFRNSSGIALGNAIGSNITNIALVVGVTALITPIRIQSQLLRREFPILFLVSLVLGGLLWNNSLSRIDGVILLLLLVLYLSWLVWVGRNKKEGVDVMAREYEAEIPPPMSLIKAWTWWFVGLILILLAAEWLVASAVTIAKWLDVSEFIIGLTVVAVGTSLPELAVTLASGLRREHDIAIGNVVGSNIFNILAVITVPALITPGTLPPNLLTRDYPVMIGFTLLLWLFAFLPLNKKATIGRFEGLLLLLGFVGYILFLILSSDTLT